MYRINRWISIWVCLAVLLGLPGVGNRDVQARNILADPVPPDRVIGWGSNEYGQTTVPDDLTDAIAIAAGAEHSLALKSDGTVVARGNNDSGQLNVPGDLTDAIAIAAGERHSLALKIGGTVVAWGDNSTGQRNVPGELSGVIAIAAGAFHSLALKNDGTVVAWGNNNHGQTTIPGELSGVIAIAAGDRHSLALKSDRTVVAWGLNDNHQTDIPAGLSSVIAIAAGYRHSLALKDDGTVMAWGLNDNHQTDIPAGLSSVIAIAAGYSHSLALMSGGTVVAWGNNESGQTDIPAGLSGVAAITAGNRHSLAIYANSGPIAQDQAVATGPDTPVAITLGATDREDDPLTYTVVTNPAHGALSGTPPVVTYTPGAGFTGADSFTFQANDGQADGTIGTVLIKIGEVIGWGWNESGQIDVPAGLTDVIAIAAGYGHSLALKSDGTVVAWGWNTSGQTEVPAGLTDAIAIAAGEAHSLALKSDGTVVVWGNNEVGQLAIPDGLSGVAAIAAGFFHSLALKSDGTVVFWGYNIFGQADVPEGLSGVIAMDGGGYHSLALKSDGTVVAWGDNGYFQSTVPDGLSGVTAIAAGLFHSLALKSDGTVVAWGDNGFGKTDIPAGLSGVTAIAAGEYHNLALLEGNHAPVAQDQAVATGQDTPAAITLAATDGDNDPLTYAVVTDPAHGTLTGTPPAVTYMPAPGYTGADSFTFQANDGFADSNIATVTISVQGEAPPLPASYYGEIHIYDNPPAAGAIISAFKPGDVDAVATAEVQENGGTLSYTLIVPGGSKGAASEGDIVTIRMGERVVGSAAWHSGANMALDLHPPQALPGGPYSGNNYAAVSFTGSANDWGTDITQYQWDWNNDGTYDDTGNPQTHVWNSPGVYPVTLRVTDGQGGEGLATFDVTITNLTPVLDPIGNRAVDELVELAFSATASDTDPLTYSLVDDNETGAAINATTGIFTWTPSEAQGPGNYPFTVRVCDTLLACDEESITVAVNEVNTAPVLVAIDDQSIEEMALLSFTASATDADIPANSLTYSLVGAPSGAAIDSASGVFSWTPTYDQGPATYTFSVRACDLAPTPLCADESLTVTVTLITRTHSVNLVAGWNLVSFNVHPASSAVGDVLASVAGNYDLVYAWDASGGHSATGNWLKHDNIPVSQDNLTDLTESMGFWIHMTAADTLEVTGTVNPLTSMAYYDNVSGWNLMAYPSAVNGAVPGIFDDHNGAAVYFVYGYEAADTADPWELYDRVGPGYANDLAQLLPGRGYWVRVNADGTWTAMY